MDSLKKKILVVGFVKTKEMGKTDLVELLMKNETWDLGWNTSLKFLDKMKEMKELSFEHTGLKNKQMVKLGEKSVF